MKIRRLFVLVLIVCMLCPAALAQQAEPAASGAWVMMGYEPESETRAWGDSLFFSRMEALTGVSFTFRQYGDVEAYRAAREEAFSTGEMPDVLFKACLSPAEEMRLLQDGQIIDLAPYLESCMPTLWTILEARPDWREIITQPDGAIASLPLLNGAQRQCAVWINGQWLDALGLTMPETIDEYTQVLRAFRDMDPNGNGKQDEVPLSLVGPWEAKFLLHAWGLTPNDYNLYVDQSGTVCFAPYQEEFRAFVEWLHMALEEGLVDSQAFRQSQSMRTASLTTTDTSDNQPQTLGGMISVAPYTLVSLDDAVDYVVLTPLAYEQERVYRQLLGGVARGTFAVTSACEDVEAVLRWADYLYTEEGGRLAFAGEEGVDYTMDSQGRWRWTAEDNYGTLTNTLSLSIIAGDDVTPGLEPAAFMRNTEIDADNHVRRQTDTLRDYLVEPFPATWPTDEAREARIAELQAALAPCIDTAIANFAMGLTELNDETWQDFLQTLEELGAEEFIALWQEKLDETA